MGQITARLFHWLKDWDRPSKLALGIAAALLILTLALAVVGPTEIRTGGVIAFAGLVIVTQAIILWGNRGMVAPYTKAQRFFMTGDYETAREILENLNSSSKADVNALTLLGNTYRQLGLLDESESILNETITIKASYYFPLYGFGRTLAAKGNYAAAADAIQRALELGAPRVVQFDLADIRYRQGLWEEARALLQAVRPLLQEPYRLLMTDYLLCRLDAGEAPDNTLIQAGLPYWEETARRFRHTPYGAAIAEDIQWLQACIKEHTT
jgi:tetratricopeptide (TPR) repeat protein